MAISAPGQRGFDTRRLWAGVTGGVVFLVASIALHFAFGRPILSMIAARGWTATNCEIIRSRVSETDGDLSSGGGSRNRSYSAVVTYRYFVAGHMYIGDRARFTAIKSNNPSDAASTVSLLLPGSKVSCWYDPAKPASSVIDRDPTTDLIWIVFPVGAAVVGAAVLGYAIFGNWNPESVAVASTTGTKSGL